MRFLGLSEAGPATDSPCACGASHLRSAVGVLAVRARRRGVRCFRPLRELGIGFVAYSPLGRGILTAARHARDARRDRHPPQADSRASRRGTSTPTWQSPRASRAIATERGVTAAQLALAWLLHRGTDIVPIPGTKRRVAPRGECGRRRGRPGRRRHRSPRGGCQPGERAWRTALGHGGDRPLTTRYGQREMSAPDSHFAWTPTAEQAGASRLRHFIDTLGAGDLDGVARLARADPAAILGGDGG